MFSTEEFKTPECRVSYAQGLFEAKAIDVNKPNDKKYSVTLIFSNKDRPTLEKMVAAAIVGEWGEKGLEMAKNGLIKSPFYAGDGKEARSKETGEIREGLGADLFFIRPAANEDKPPVVRFKSANIPAQKNEIGSGDYGFSVLVAFTYDHPVGGKGVSFGLRYFQKLRDGESLGGGAPTDANKWHEKIEDTGAAPEATKAGAGAGGLFG